MYLQQQKGTALFTLKSLQFTFSVQLFPQEKLELSIKTDIKEEFQLLIQEHDPRLYGYFANLMEMFDCFLDPETLKKKKKWYRSKEFQEEKIPFIESITKELNYEELLSNVDWQYSISSNGLLRIISIDEDTELTLPFNKLEQDRTDTILEQIKKEMKIMNGKVMEQEQEIKRLKGQIRMVEGKQEEIEKHQEIDEKRKNRRISNISNQDEQTIEDKIKEVISLMEEKEKRKMEDLEEKISKKIDEIQNQGNQRLLNLRQETRKSEEQMEQRIKETFRTIQNNSDVAVNTCNMNINEIKYQFYMTQILTEQFKQLPKEKQNKIKESFAAIIKENKEELDLSDCQLNGNEIRYSLLANQKNIKKVNLNDNEVGDNGARELATTEWPNLQQLNLQNNSIGVNGARELATAKWPNLQYLGLEHNSIKDNGARELATAEWPNLQQLNLQRNSIGDNGARELATAKWPNLQQLNLQYNKIGVNGARELATAEWPNLQQLNLENNSIGQKGIFNSIHQFYLGGNNVSNDLKALLRSKYPQAHIYF